MERARELVEIEERRKQVATFIQSSLQPAKQLIEDGSLSNVEEDINAEAQDFEVREYQLDAWAALWDARQAGAKSGLVHLATGLGKTSVGVFDVIKYRSEYEGRRKRGPRILFTSHKNEINEQAAERFQAFIPDATQSFYSGTDDVKDSDITFATLQSLHRNLDSFKPGYFDYIVFDEAHHGKASTFENVIKHFKPKFQLALTATPERLDRLNIEELFGEALYSKGLAEALSEGLLADPDYHIVFDDAVKEAMRSGFEPTSLSALAELMNVMPRNEIIAKNIREEIERIGLKFGDVKTIIFCQSVEHATEMSMLLDGQPYHSGLKKQQKSETLAAFKDGDLQVITTRDMFNEGVDIPDARLLVFLRSTSSKTIFEQQLGRGLRKKAGKEQVSVLDFVANVERIAMIQELANQIQTLKPKINNGKGEQHDPTSTAENRENGLVVHTNHGDFDFDKLSVDLLEKYEQLLNVPLAPEGYIRVATAATLLNTTSHIIQNLIEQQGWELPIYRFEKSTTGRALDPDQLDFLRQHPEVTITEAGEDYFSLNSAADKFGVSAKVLDRLVEEFGWDLPYRKFGPKTTRAISLVQINELRHLKPDYFAEPPEEGWRSIKGTATDLGVDHYTVRRIVEEFGWDLPKRKFGGGVVTFALSPEQITQISNHPKISVKQSTEDIVSIGALAGELNTSPDTIHSIAKEKNLTLGTFAFGKGRTRGIGITLAQAETIRANLTPPYQEGEIKLKDAATILGIHHQTLMKIVSEVGITLPKRRFGRGHGLIVTPEQMELLKSSDYYNEILNDDKAALRRRAIQRRSKS